MKTLAAVVFSLAIPAGAMASPQTYNIDPLHSFPNFAVNHLGMTMVHGRFERMTGKIVLDATAKSGSMEIKVPTATVSTGDAKRADGARARDEHLRSADFFNSAEFPEMVFRSNKLNFAGDKVEASKAR